MLSSLLKYTSLVFSIIFLGLTFVSAVEYPVEVSVLGEVNARVRFAIPESRVGVGGTNWDVNFYLYLKNLNTQTIAYKMDFLTSTFVAGENITPILFSAVSAGNYDVFIKTHQHLSKKLSNITLVNGLNIFNFSTIDNTPDVIGPVRLLAGDISGIGNTPDTLGDNEINSIDLNIMLDSLDIDDLSTRDVRANLNQDVIVNSVDLSLLLKNLDLQGE
jgi:hypothetical protein